MGHPTYSTSLPISSAWIRCAATATSRLRPPALDGLADDGFVFENAYVSQPVCSPARATMLTGLWPHTAGVPACNVPLRAEVPDVCRAAAAGVSDGLYGQMALGG